MSSVFGKLNLKHQRKILVANAPSTFEPELAGWNTMSMARSRSKAKN